MTLLKYIEEQWTAQGKPINEIFRPGEWNEVVRLMYILLKRAILDGANRFIITEIRFFWDKDGQLLGERTWDDIINVANVSPKNAFKLVLERDEIVRQHLHPMTENEEELIYQIINE